MAEGASQFYPPRSRWYSPIRVHWLRFRLYIPTLWALCHEKTIVGLRAAILSLVIPGFAFRAFGHRKFGNIAMSGCAISFLVYFIWLGYSAATFAFAAILSLHVISIIFLHSRLVPQQHFVFRIGCAFVILVVMNFGVYGFLRNQLQKFLMPLRIGENVIVVNSRASDNIQRGDWIAYRVGEIAGTASVRNVRRAVIIRNGFGIDQVLATEGDTVRFGKSALQVNDKNYPRRTHMPISGEISISEKQWFVWPSFAIQNNMLDDGSLTELVASYAVVSENDFVGKPFKRWFWRKQILQ